MKYEVRLESDERGRWVLVSQSDESGEGCALRIPESEFLEVFHELSVLGESLGIVSPLQPEKSHTLEEKRMENPKAYTPWTPEEEDELRNLHDAGSTVEEISRQLQRNAGAIRSRLNKLGLGA